MSNKNEKLPESKKSEILKALFPWGYGCRDNKFYIGESPYMKDSVNVIKFVDGEYFDKGSAFSIVVSEVCNDYGYENVYGFYAGIMSLVAPEYYCEDGTINETMDLITFYKIDDSTKASS